MMIGMAKEPLRLQIIFSAAERAREKETGVKETGVEARAKAEARVEEKDFLARVTEKDCTARVTEKDYTARVTEKDYTAVMIITVAITITMTKVMIY